MMPPATFSSQHIQLKSVLPILFFQQLPNKDSSRSYESGLIYSGMTHHRRILTDKSALWYTYG